LVLLLQQIQEARRLLRSTALTLLERLLV
jgi:hypothetical protein